MDAEDELVRDVYAHFGLAAYCGQVFEEGLCGLLLILARLKAEAVTLPQIEALELKTQKKTMGALLGDLRKKMQLAPNTEAVMSTALERRNFLTHGYFRERAEAFMSEQGRRSMIEELAEIREAIQQANRLATTFATRLMRLFGVTPEMLQADFEQAKRRA